MPVVPVDLDLRHRHPPLGDELLGDDAVVRQSRELRHGPPPFSDLHNGPRLGQLQEVREPITQLPHSDADDFVRHAVS